MYASNQVNGGKLKIQVDCKVHGDKYETELNEFDEIDGDEETLPVHKGDVITLTLTGGTLAVNLMNQETSRKMKKMELMKRLLMRSSSSEELLSIRMKMNASMKI